jgi:hypothetical protein
VFLRNRQNGTTELISIGMGGASGAGQSRDPYISLNGRFVAFESEAPDLVPGDTNGAWDVFVRDRLRGTTERVSVRSDGTQGGAASRDPAISSGRFVVFHSHASNLVQGDSNHRADVFIHDRRSKTTRRVSLSSTGAQARRGTSANATVSASGRYVAFDSTANDLVANDTNGDRDIFVRDMKGGTTERASVGPGRVQSNDDSFDPSISSSGRWVSFESNASNLVNRDSNGQEDAFVHDRTGRKTIRVSIRTNGKQAKGGRSDDAAISGDGRFVVFESEATNLVRGDTNGADDVFRRGPLH